MLKPRKKITRREMKQDKLVTYYFKATDFIHLHGTRLLLIVGGVLAIFIAATFYSKMQTKNEKAAVVELTKAQAKYNNYDFQGAVEILKKLVDDYGSTKSGKMAQLYLADAYYNLKDYSQAERYFKEYKDGDDILGASAISGLAACWEEQGKFKEAAEMYKKAAEKFSNGFMAPENLYHAARCYALAGNIAEARKVLNDLIEKYADAPVKNDAQLFLGELSS
jgi:tetratricopeptide (TPR) repeat protein